jgi:pimeloyl-ACP methyl ester carboxylesterase
MMAPHLPVPAALQGARPEDPYPANLSQVQVPVLLVAGVLDPLVELGWTRNMLEFLPHAQVANLPYKHSPNISHPAQTWAVLNEFLTENARAHVASA